MSSPSSLLRAGSGLVGASGESSLQEQACVMLGKQGTGWAVGTPGPGEQGKAREAGGWQGGRTEGNQGKNQSGTLVWNSQGFPR